MPIKKDLQVFHVFSLVVLQFPFIKLSLPITLKDIASENYKDVDFERNKMNPNLLSCPQKPNEK